MMFNIIEDFLHDYLKSNLTWLIGLPWLDDFKLMDYFNPTFHLIAFTS